MYCMYVHVLNSESAVASVGGLSMVERLECSEDGMLHVPLDGRYCLIDYSITGISTLCVLPDHLPQW